MKLFGTLNKLITFLLLAGNTLLLLLIIISGSINHFPIDKFYWLEADTSGIGSAGPISMWTFWGVCTKNNDGLRVCDDLKPAFPLSPFDNFGTTTNLPVSFVNNRDTYFYLTRFSFCFFLIALAFIGIALIMCILSWCSYTFTKIVFTFVTVGAIMDIGAVCFQTAATVMARNAFHDVGRDASLGASLIGIAWGSVGCSIILFFTTGITFIKKVFAAHKEYVEMQKYKEQALMYQGKNEAASMEGFDMPQDLEGGATQPMPLELPSNKELSQSQDSHRSGIKFFKIRRTPKTDDDESI